MHVATTCAFLLAATLSAETRPSFRLDRCSWLATHVVVVTEGDRIDGKVTVLESWQGDLEPLEVIEIPELAAFRTETSRHVNRSWLDPEEEKVPDHVTGRRMVLFLKATPHKRIWEAASEEMLVSTLWIEGEQSFAFVQIMNPGDSILVGQGQSEKEIRSRVEDVAKIHDALNQATEVQDLAARSRALAAFVRSELYDARDTAFSRLRECGRPAVPVLLELLHDEANLSMQDEVIGALAAIGGEGVGEELTQVVREELLFWKSTVPRLREGWWNAIEEPETSTLRDRYGRLYAALTGLQKLRFAGCRDVVAELRDFWRSLPQLEDPGGLDQISKTCDLVLGSTSR